MGANWRGRSAWLTAGVLLMLARPSGSAPADDGAPSGMVAFFAGGNACPAGWTVADLDPLALPNVHIQALCRATLTGRGTERTGLGILEQLVIGRKRQARPRGRSDADQRDQKARLAERVELAGGSLDYGPTADGGFRLQATLPWA